MARRLQALCRTPAEHAALRARWWGLALFIGVTLLPALCVSGLSLANIFSRDFREPDCWIGDSGHWVTANEGLMWLTLYVLPVFLVVGSVVGLGLWRSSFLTLRLFLSVSLASVALVVANYAVNAALNDGYIDRLYEACGRS